MVNAKEHYQRFLERARSRTSGSSIVYVTKDIPLVDIFFDQLEFLVAHAAAINCPPDCLNCKRLQHVSYWLALPFQEKTDSE